jgi:hypothetical protein
VPVTFSDCHGALITSLTLPDLPVGQLLSGSFCWTVTSGWYGGASSSDAELSVVVAGLGVPKVDFTFTPSSPGSRNITVTVETWDKGSPVRHTGALHILVNVLPA